MAITIQKQPTQDVPAYNDIVYIVSSDNTSEANFKYVADIYIGSDMIRVTANKHPDYTNGLFNIGRIIESYVNSDINKDLNGFQLNLNSYTPFYIQFGEEYGSTPTVYPNLTTSSTHYAWNGVLDFLPYQSYDQNDYVMRSSVADGKFLTNMPQSGVIRSSEDAWLYSVGYARTDIYGGQIVTYDSTGAPIQTLIFSNPHYLVASVNGKYLRMPAGTNNLNNIPASAVVLGSLPIIDSNVAKYDVAILDSGFSVYDFHSFTVDNTCTKNEVFRFHFLNQLGGYDSFTFYRGNIKTSNIERSNYKQVSNVMTSATTSGYNTYSRGKKDFNITISENIKVQSDWVNQATMIWLEELITSPDVYLDHATYGLVAVNINNSNYEIKQDAQEKLFNLTLDFNYSYNKYRQRG